MVFEFFKKKPTIINIQHEITNNTTIPTDVSFIIAEYAHEYLYSHKLVTYQQIISVMTLLSNGKIAVSTNDGVIRILDILSGKCLCKLVGHVRNVISVIELANKNIASSAYDNTIRIWNIDDFITPKYIIPDFLLPDFMIPDIKSIKRYTITGCLLYTMVELPDERLAIATCTGVIIILNLVTAATVALKGHYKIVYDLKVHNNKLASCSADGTMRVWDITGEICLLEYLCCSSALIYSIAWLSDNAIIYGMNNGIICIWDIGKNLKYRKMIGHEGSIYDMVLLSNNILVSSSGDNTICLWDMDSGRCMQRLRKHVSAVRHVIVYNDIILSGWCGATIKIWK